MLNRRRQRGLSIVEVMVGVTIGLFIVSAAAMMVSGQLVSNRRLLLDTQLQQDLRAAAEIVSREMRRNGALLDVQAIGTAWQPDPDFSQLYNIYAHNFQPAAGSPPASTTTYYYDRVVDTFRFKIYLETTRHRLQSIIQNTAQDLTDPEVMKVTSFSLTTVNAANIQLQCPKECPGGGYACWPKVSVRDVQIDIAGESAADTNIKRSIRTTVRMRNDMVRRDASITTGMCPA